MGVFCLASCRSCFSSEGFHSFPEFRVDFGIDSSIRSRITESTSRTPRGAAAGVALQAGAVAHEGEVAAFAAGFAFVTLGLGFGAHFGGVGFGLGARLAARHRQMVRFVVRFELFGRREFLFEFGLQRRGPVRVRPALEGGVG